jgi:SWIM zinc finger
MHTSQPENTTQQENATKQNNATRQTKTRKPATKSRKDPNRAHKEFDHLYRNPRPEWLAQEVIDTAYKNAQRDAVFYRIFLHESGEAGIWRVEHKGREKHRQYVVNAFDWTCTCPYFANESFCKHCVMVKDVLLMDTEIDFFLADTKAQEALEKKYATIEASCGAMEAECDTCHAPSTDCQTASTEACWSEARLPCLSKCL